jgi:hypothetical protein
MFQDAIRSAGHQTRGMSAIASSLRRTSRNAACCEGRLSDGYAYTVGQSLPKGPVVASTLGGLAIFWMAYRTTYDSPIGGTS